MDAASSSRISLDDDSVCGRATIGSNDVQMLESTTYMELASWCLAGMSGWWSLNVIIAELPYFVAELPEAARLGNLLAVCTQLGNVAPFVYKAIYPHVHGRLTAVVAFAHGLSTITLSVCAFFWNVQVGGVSIVLLVCTFLAGCVGCLSNVTFWAVAAAHPAACTRAMSVGMTFGGVVAIAFSVIQLCGRQQGAERFGPRTLFCIAAIVQALQAIAFLLQVKHASQRQVSGASCHPSIVSCRGSEVTGSSGGSFRPDLEGPTMEALSETGGTGSGDARLDYTNDIRSQPFLAKVLLGCCFLIYGATYTVPTLQPFMVSGFSDTTQRQQLFLGMLILQNIGDVLGRAATACIGRTRGIFTVWVLLLVTAFTAMVYLTTLRYWIGGVLAYGSAWWLFSGACGVYYFSRGLLVTAVYLRARLVGRKPFSEQLSMNLGTVFSIL